MAATSLSASQLAGQLVYKPAPTCCADKTISLPPPCATAAFFHKPLLGAKKWKYRSVPRKPHTWRMHVTACIPPDSPAAVEASNAAKVAPGRTSEADSESQSPKLSRREALIAAGAVAGLAPAALQRNPAVAEADFARSAEPAAVAALRERVSAFALSNGMRWLVLERHNAPVIACHTYADVGASVEVEGQTGIAHLLEHM